MQKKSFMRGPGLWLVLLLLVVVMVQMLMWPTQVENKEISYSEFLQLVQDEKISQLMVSEYNAYGLYKDSTISESSFPERYDFTLQIPNDVASFYDDVKQVLATARGVDPESITPLDYGFTLVNQPAPQPAWWVEWIPFLIMILLLVAFWFFFMRQQMGGNNKVMNFGKAHARTVTDDKNRVTFAQVAGADEEKEELREIVEFLKHSDRFMQLGARIPKGVLLIGPPGTGKTLLAKAVAGEANVPFFSISGSDFVEMFVGVGASRVRDLFQQAAKVAPAIIFIDEIDAIGRTRDSKFGGNDEREQTLNQLLAEIDGFDSSKGVVILAATNRPEILDKALLRAGRFDRRIIVDRPNLAGRYQTLRVHTKNIKLAEDVDLHKIAQATAGAVGADLANLVNEAALRAVRMGRKAVNQQDLLTSFELVIAGTEKKGTVLTDTEKRIVSYHEVGHALVAALQKHSQPVSKITIVPHTSGALGYTMQMPEEENFLSSKEELIVELQTMLGGRAAEQVVFGIATTGASNDIERATELARKMVTQYGMSDRLGLMALSTVSNPYLDGSTMMNCADSTSSAADEEIHKLLMDCYADAKNILVEHRALLDEIAMYLLSKETITGDEFMAYVNADSKKLTDGSEAEEAPEQDEAPSETD